MHYHVIISFLMAILSHYSLASNFLFLSIKFASSYIVFNHWIVNNQFIEAQFFMRLELVSLILSQTRKHLNVFLIANVKLDPSEST